MKSYHLYMSSAMNWNVVIHLALILESTNLCHVRYACFFTTTSFSSDGLYVFYGFFRSSDKKNTSDKGAYKTLIDELNFLSRVGINIDVSGVVRNVKFKLVLFVRDHVGLNSIFGCNESFISHYSCRICKCSKDEATKLSMEDKSKLRKRQNYGDDVQRHNASETGIKKECTLHNVDDSHNTENISVNLMHEFLEGVCMFVMHNLIYTFVYVKEYFTLGTLNAKVAAFNYRPSEALNKPPTIVLDRVLKHDKLKMFASEALTFVRSFGLILGELIPEDDALYKLYRYLRRILDILLPPRFIKADAIVLAEFI
ncbi:hypothetical protein QAD02_013186 [Eretmocerus hayati]|uniref:Uncharacterized protein n=1 Tax=Eretmocerus hayati TaxID=131215 RepID=A0ACC2P265_9HYME|nr:hypothetical protein QAD02_013186 [Eretmocerus hayati]